MGPRPTQGSLALPRVGQTAFSPLPPAYSVTFQNQSFARIIFWPQARSLGSNARWRDPHETPALTQALRAAHAGGGADRRPVPRNLRPGGGRIARRPPRRRTGLGRTNSVSAIPGRAGLERPLHRRGRILTSAGTAAAINCCLHVVRKDHVAEIANRIARRQVVAPHRHGGQAQYIEKPVPHAADADGLDATISWPSPSRTSRCRWSVWPITRA